MSPVSCSQAQTHHTTIGPMKEGRLSQVAAPHTAPRLPAQSFVHGYVGGKLKYQFKYAVTVTQTYLNYLTSSTQLPPCLDPGFQSRAEAGAKEAAKERQQQRRYNRGSRLHSMGIKCINVHIV